MVKANVWSAAVALAAVSFLAGCAEQEAAPPQAAEDWKAGLDAEVVSGLSPLSPADRQAALAQRVCPVTGQPLGSMGTPPKVTVEGQEVFLCCSGCEDKLKQDPAKYLPQRE